MKGNTDKCHLLLSKDESSEIYKEDSIVESSTYEKLLGIKIDSKLRLTNIFNIYVTKLTENYKHLARATPYVNLQKEKSFNESLFQHTIQLLFVDLGAS